MVSYSILAIALLLLVRIFSLLVTCHGKNQVQNILYRLVRREVAQISAKTVKGLHVS